MADNFVTNLSQLPLSTQQTITKNAAGVQVAAKKNAEGVITEYRAMTPEEYLASRGGVNTVTGKFGDSFNQATDLTNEEYLAAVQGKTGLARGAAINAATQAKIDAYNASRGYTPPTTVNAGLTNAYSTGAPTTEAYTGPSLAKDVFKNTLALFFGTAEMAKPWADELYTTVSKYYKTGATTEESFNLALQDAYQRKAMPEFTNRFKGIFKLQEQRQAGKPVTVPTIAEYFATQSKMADLLKTTGLDDLATEDFLGDVIGKGVSATEFGTRITNIFDRIDLAPQEMKDTLARYFPTLDRTQLAKALALGEKGSMQLQKELAGYEVLAAAEEQGLGALGAGAIAGGLTEERAASLAAAGETYQSALGKFKTVAQIKEPAAKLAGIYGTSPMTQEDIENIIFKQSAQETKALENLINLEQSMFSGQAGTIGSRSFASQARGAGLI